MTATNTQMAYLFNHIMLPPQLPQINDTSDGLDISSQFFTTCVEEFYNFCDEEEERYWSDVAATASLWTHIHEHSLRDASTMQTSLEGMKVSRMFSPATAVST